MNHRLPHADQKALPCLSPAEGYRLWAPYYDSEVNPLLALEKRIIFSVIGSLVGRVFLDAGCGTGRWMAEASAHGATVLGVDLCSEMLAVAARKPGLAGRLVRADNRRLPLLSGCVDIVICSFTLSYLESPERALLEMGRVTRPGAEILVSDLHPRAQDAGWKRAFRAGGQPFEIRSFPHSLDQLVLLGRQAGWKIRDTLEPCFGKPERPLFRRAGREDLFESVASLPAVMILRWHRP